MWPAVGWRRVGTYALSGRLGANVSSGYRQIHRFSPRPVRLVAEPSRAWLGQTQTRSFNKASYTGEAHHNEKAEEVLEALEVRDDEKDTQPPRHVLGQNGERPSSAEQDTEWSDEVTKGESCR